jgi:phage protein D
MTTTTLQHESTEQGGFYVPRYEVKIAGASLPRDVLFDVRSLTYHDDVDGLDGFDLVVNNWDEKRRAFKYIGSETKAQLAEGHPDRARFTLFEPCGKEVELRLGYGNRFTTMLKGTFTTMQPTYDSGAAQLTVSGLNVLHQLRRKQYTTTWTDEKDSEIAQDIAQCTDNGRKRFPLPIKIDDEALGKEKPLPLVTQENAYDIDFLYQRARKRGYVVFVQEADSALGRERQLYFGPSKPGMIPGLRDVMFEFAWGRSLIEFKPTIKTANQISSVTVRGWHRTRKEAISRTVTLDDQRITTNTDLHRVINACAAREEMVVDEPVFTNCEARERAIAILLDQTKEMVTAEVEVVGLPALRAGQVVVIKELGARLSGKYFVTKTTHTVDDSGYLTSFSCRREGSVD